MGPTSALRHKDNRRRVDAPCHNGPRGESRCASGPPPARNGDRLESLGERRWSGPRSRAARPKPAELVRRDSPPGAAAAGTQAAGPEESAADGPRCPHPVWVREPWRLLAPVTEAAGG